MPPQYGADSRVFLQSRQLVEANLQSCLKSSQNAGGGPIQGRRKCRLPRRRIHKCRAIKELSRAASCMFFGISGENPQLAHRKDVFSDNRGPRRATADISGMQRTVGDAEASKRVRSERMARRPNAAVGVVCPRCGMLAARIIGRSESLPVIYLTCEDCGRTSVAPSGEQA